ncbi:MAG: hypothetical protein ITD33_06340 [Nitrosarchaeum sp.]|nr:hypothetical protein [Nitrosarchaeum sp.]MBP0120454.1 hypothetical protein [Nitrosarchaeum sp.]MBP0133998.1 hypothetical protein [Nitrosarchaeum sp.]
MKQIFSIFAVLMIFIILFNPVFATTQLEKMNISNVRLVDASNNKLPNQINVNQQVQISADVKNNQEKNQNFTYIVQVKNQEGIVVSLGWISSTINAGQTFSPALSWAPKISDIYTVEIFVWEAADDGTDIMGAALTEQKIITITS